MFKMIMGGLAVLLLAASAAFWMLRPGTQRTEGSAAPDFALPDQNGRIHRLGDYAGRWLVLYFYPRDDTPGCTREACRFRDDIGTLGKLDAAVVGVSVDSAQSHAAFSRKYQSAVSACCPTRTDAPPRPTAACSIWESCVLPVATPSSLRRTDALQHASTMSIPRDTPKKSGMSC